MDALTKRLKRELDVAMTDYTQKLDALKSAERDFEVAEHELASIRTVLYRLTKTNPTDTPPVPKPKRRKATLADLVEGILRNQHVLTTEQLLIILEREGRTTTLKSLAVTLGRQKPDRFRKTPTGFWYLADMEGSLDPEALDKPMSGAARDRMVTMMDEGRIEPTVDK
jgi:hypothetical protein